MVRSRIVNREGRLFRCNDLTVQRITAGSSVRSVPDPVLQFPHPQCGQQQRFGARQAAGRGQLRVAILLVEGRGLPRAATTLFPARFCFAATAAGGLAHENIGVVIHKVVLTWLSSFQATPLPPIFSHNHSHGSNSHSPI